MLKSQGSNSLTKSNRYESLAGKVRKPQEYTIGYEDKKREFSHCKTIPTGEKVEQIVANKKFIAYLALNKIVVLHREDHS